MARQSGIYIHIPFCRNKCRYCNFYSKSSAAAGLEEFLEALEIEISLQKNYLAASTVETLYFGGGTPSLLSHSQISGIIDLLIKTFDVTANPEITLEVNPNDITQEYATALAATPVNRISIGTQSFRDEDLQYLGRIHNARQAMDAVSFIHKAGFENISADLIYGVPGMNNSAWLGLLNTMASLPVKHLSCYALTVEKDTPLYKDIASGKLSAPDEELAAQQYEILLEWSANSGFEQYEISNFCKKGYESRHNSSYWNGTKYLGLGPSAHSFNGTTRSWNVASVADYISSLAKKIIPAETEVLSSSDIFNDYIMTGLRTSKGIDLEQALKGMPVSQHSRWLQLVRKYEAQGMIARNDSNVFLSNRGKLLADAIIADLFM